MSENELREAMKGAEVSPSPAEGGGAGKKMINQLETTSDLDECLTVAKDAFDIAMEVAKSIDNKIGRLVAETTARIAYAVGRAFCRAEYG